jgi:hypothetical protein
LTVYNILIALGPKLQTVWPLVMLLFAKFQEAAEIVNQIRAALGQTPSPGIGTLAMESCPQDVLDAEAKLGQLLAAEGAEAAFDGSRLRGIFKFLEDSGLADLFIAALRGWLAGT